jgi:predicted nucleic-acid-binding protein
MFALDTNVVVRAIVQDDPEQAARARAVIEEHDVWLAKTVLLESAWVLESVYEYSPDEVLKALKGLLGLPGVHVEDEAAVAQAFRTAAGGAEFADALHVASMPAAVEAFLSFDRSLSRVKGLARLVQAVP